MAQFDVYRNPNPQTAANYPYLLDLQNDLLGKLPTRVVVPLSPREALSWNLQRLTPVFEVEGVEVFMNTADLASIYCRELGEPVTSLAGQRDEILAAVDFLFFGI